MAMRFSFNGGVGSRIVLFKLLNILDQFLGPVCFHSYSS